MYLKYTKYIIVWGIFISTHLAAQSQQRDSTAGKLKLKYVYINYGWAYLTDKTFLGDVGMNFIFSNSYGISPSLQVIWFQAKEKPMDYLYGYNDGNPEDKLTSYSLAFMGEYFYKYPMLRLGVEAGPSIVQASTAHFTKRALYNKWESNYEAYYTSGKLKPGLFLKAKVEFPVFRLLGIQLALVSNINPITSYIGGEFHVTIGLVRQKID